MLGIDKTINTTATYIGGMVYESKTTIPADAASPDYTDRLQFISHEEGRIRFKPSAGQIPASMVYDYLLKDHLGNIRMVLTEEDNLPAIYKATMEGALNDSETQLFDKIPETRDGKPGGFETVPVSTNEKVSKLFSSATEDKRTGPGVVLKVMSGDKFKARVLGWYQPGNTDASQPTGLNGIATQIINSLTGGIVSAGKATASQSGAGL